jgi:AraC family transcriptional regulator, arabinose operon regulatory protein
MCWRNLSNDYLYRRPYGSDDWLLFCTLGGSGRIGTGSGRCFTTSTGDLVLHHPGRAQDYGTDPVVGTWDLCWAHFRPRPQWTMLLQWPEQVRGIGHVRIADPQAFATIGARCLDVARLAATPRRLRDEHAMNALEHVLLLCDDHNPAHARGRIDPRIRRVIDRMCADIAHPWTVATLAAIADMSAVRFAHRFTDDVHESPRKFLERQRMEHAKKLLATTREGIAEIAATIGFADPLYFSARFRACFGRSPSAYRAGRAR